MSELIKANQQIYHLRRGGMSVDEIADHLGISSAEVVRGFRAYMVDLMKDTPQTEREHAVALDLDRLDHLMQPFYAAGTEGDKDGAQVTLQIMNHRMKLLRLDQPHPDELNKGMQVIVVTGGKEEYEAALRAGQERLVAGQAGDDDLEEEGR